MEILAAIQIASQLASVGMGLFEKFSAASALITKAQSEGRTTLTKAEWDAVISLDDVARAKLDAAIKAAGG